MADNDTPYLSPAVRLERIIATGHAAATPVDANGRPIGKPATFTYDAAGRFVSATRAEPDDAA